MLFSRRPKPDAEIAARIKAWSRAALDLDGDASFAVNEIICHDPGCPGTETVVLVMVPGRRTSALKVTKPMAEVTAGDIVGAVAEAAALLP